MANRFWVGGSDTWNTTSGNKWSDTSGGAGGFIRPQTGDNAIFDANSGSVTVTLGTSYTCTDVIFTGFTGTFAGSSALHVNGSLTFSSGMTLTYTGNIYMDATGTGKTLTTAGKTLLGGNLTFDGSGGGWTLQDNVTCNWFRHWAGTLDTNNKTIACTTLQSDTSYGAATLSLGSSVVTVTGDYGACTIDSGVTVSANTATLKMNTAGVVAPITMSMALGTHSFSEVWITGSGNIATTISDGATLGTFKADGGTKTLNMSGTYAVSTFDIPGTGGTISIHGSATFSKASGTVNVYAVSLKDMAASGGATFIANDSTDEGGNSGWTFLSPNPNVYDSVTAQDVPTVRLDVSVSKIDTLTLSDLPTATSTGGSATVYDTITLDDNASVFRISQNTALAQEMVTLSDVPTTSSSSTTSKSDAIVISDVIVDIQVFVPPVPLVFSVFDSCSLSEDTGAQTFVINMIAQIPQDRPRGFSLGMSTGSGGDSGTYISFGDIR